MIRISVEFHQDDLGRIYLFNAHNIWIRQDVVLPTKENLIDDFFLKEKTREEILYNQSVNKERARERKAKILAR